MPLLQLGSFHGTSILLPKHIANPNENEVELFVYSNIISHIIQFGAVFTLFLFDIDLNRLIILVIGANFFFLFIYSKCIRLSEFKSRISES